jgi:hypothetical protein
MNPLVDFFGKLTGVHLLFWKLTFKYYDAIPIFLAILAIVGLNDLATTQSLKETGNYIVLQFIIFVLCFSFCYVWPDFRQNRQDISINMICLCLSVAFLAAVFALVIKLILAIQSLQSTVGDGIRRFISDLQIFPVDVEISLIIVLFLIAYAFMLVNTYYVEGAKSISEAVASRLLVPLMVTLVIALIATIIVVNPIVVSAL